MTAILIFFIFIVASVLLLVEQNQRLKRKAKRYAKKAQAFHEKLQRLSDPSHFFTDEEAHQLKKEYDPLFADINQLYDNWIISKTFLNDLGLNDYLDERKLINHIQMKNNEAFAAASMEKPKTEE